MLSRTVVQCADGLLSRRDAPVTVERPSTFLALLAAILGTATSTALGKLAGVLLPLAALVVSALSDAPSGVVLAAEVPHHNTGPILHVGAVVPDCELFNERKEVELVGQQVLLVIGILVVDLRDILLAVEHGKLFANLESRDEVALLEVGAKAAVLRDVCQELERHEHVLFAGHSGKHLRVRNEVAVQEVAWDGGGGHGWLRRSDHCRTVGG